MRISDWSSDVCSSDLTPALKRPSAHSMNCGFSIVIVRPSLRIRHGEVRAAAIMRSPLCQQVFTHWLPGYRVGSDSDTKGRSEEHTSELQSLMRISYAVFCLKNIIIHGITYKHNRQHKISRQVH